MHTLIPATPVPGHQFERAKQVRKAGMNHKERVLQELPPQATPKLVLRRQWLARQGFLTYNKAEQGGLAAAASYTRPGRRDTQWWAGVAKVLAWGWVSRGRLTLKTTMQAGP